jgi:hypothetical protein
MEREEEAKGRRKGEVAFLRSQFAISKPGRGVGGMIIANVIPAG